MIVVLEVTWLCGPFCVADLETVPPGFQHGMEFDQQKSTTSPGELAAFKGICPVKYL